jgi:phthiodiolone/phenolphthiodiolone dimycocerosates ketoreductase
MGNERIRFGVQVRAGTISEIIEQSVLCEKYGFDSVWYPDHFVGGNPTNMWPELITSMVMMGVNTQKIMIGSAATDTLKRHPATIAQSFATMDQIIGGRTALGLGAGEAMNLLPYGIPMANLYTKLKEAIQVIRLLWSTDFKNPANFKGKFYNLSEAFLQIRPIMSPHLPIYIGAFEPRMLELTGAFGDGWMPFSHTPGTYKKFLSGPIKSAAEKAGRAVSEIEPALLPATSISKDHDQAKKAIETAAKRFLVLLPSILKEIAPQVSHPGPHYTLSHWRGQTSKENFETISQTAEMISSDTALKTVIWGTPDDCVEQVEDFVEAGCRHMIFGIRGHNFKEVIGLLGNDVISHFREEEKKRKPRAKKRISNNGR